MTTATLTISTTFEVETCPECHIAAAYPTDFIKKRREDHHSAYCPNGHRWHYLGKTEAEQLREQLAAANRDREWFRTGEVEQRARRQEAERSAAAYKGQATKLRKRAIAGACAFCHRHFANVERHVASQHPDATPEPTDAA